MPRNIAPSIKIKTDLEADVSIFTEYLTHPKRVSYRQLILKAHPALTQSLAGQPQRKVRTLVREYLETAYTENRRAIERNIASNRLLLKKSDKAFGTLYALMDYRPAKRQTYTAISTFLPFCPFDKKSFRFYAVPKENSPEQSILAIALHEISHLLFFEQLAEWKKESGKKLNEEAKYYFKEALTAALMNDERLEKLIGYRSYKGNRLLWNLCLKSGPNNPLPIVKYLQRNILSEKSDYKERLYKTLNSFSHIQSCFIEKRRLWDRLSLNPNDQKLVEQYKTPIKINPTDSNKQRLHRRSISGLRQCRCNRKDTR
ncbi:MAG TPA: hypothetical protein PLN18_00420 [Candidatus Colwellbacteria bacterium]|nr:hypothetical protein [Candidatus Colwellbacteria bacterium]